MHTRQQGFTLLELLAIAAVILLIVGIILANMNGGGGSGTTGTGTPTTIPYPPLPTGTTSGAAAAAWIPQGQFTDGVATHPRLRTITYSFHRFEHNYLQVPSDRDVAGVSFRVNVVAQDPIDSPQIVAISNTPSSVIVNDNNAAISSGPNGLIEFEVYIPPGEASDANVLLITVEEVDSTGNIIRRVAHSNVDIIPFQ